MAATAPNLTQTTKPPLSRPKRAWELIALVAVVGVLILGELAFQGARHLGWTTYTAADGLAGNFVRSIAVASDGALWFGTEGGVSRFDGQTWTTYTAADGLADNNVTSIVVAPDGALWFGTEGAVSRFDGETWTTYATDDGLADNSVWSIAVAPDGALWFGTWGGGVSRFDGETWTTYTTDDGLADNSVRSIAVAPDGALWFGTGGGGVSRFDGQTWTTYTPADGLAGIWVPAITVAPAPPEGGAGGVLWFGAGRGVSRFDGKTWTTYTAADGLTGDQVSSIAVAPDGTLWAGTYKGGVSRFDGEAWTTYTPADFDVAEDWVFALAVDGQGRVWVGTYNGLRILDERVALPGQVLDVWARAWRVLRIGLGVAALVLLASIGWKFWLQPALARSKLWSQWKFRLYWVLASTVGIVIIYATLGLAQFVFYMDRLELAGVGAVAGAVAGIMQWLVLRRRISRAGWWVLVSAIGWAMGSIVFFYSYYRYTFWSGLVVAGAVVGIMQWLVLRRHISQAGWWILASAGGVVAGLAVFPYGIITGIVLTRLLRHPVSEARQERAARRPLRHTFQRRSGEWALALFFVAFVLLAAGGGILYLALVGIALIGALVSIFDYRVALVGMLLLAAPVLLVIGALQLDAAYPDTFVDYIPTMLGIVSLFLGGGLWRAFSRQGRWFGRAAAPPPSESAEEPVQVAEPEPAPIAELDPEALIDIVSSSRDPEERRQALAELEKRGMVDSL